MPEPTQNAAARSGFLRDLALHAATRQTVDVGSPDAARAPGLPNMSNQFNNIGCRWTVVKFQSFLAKGCRLYARRAPDRLADHALMGVALVHHAVQGTGFTEALLQAQWLNTDRNATARQILQRHFLADADGWRLNTPPTWPAHIGSKPSGTKPIGSMS